MNVLTVQKIRYATSDFADNSTMHGFKDIKDASNVVFKVMWAMAMCASFVFFVYQTKYLLDAVGEETTAVSINPDLVDEDKYQNVVYCGSDWIDLK